MATLEDVRRIALSLPETSEDSGRFGVSVAGKGFTWSWMERIQPKKPRVENRAVIAIRVANEDEKQALIAADSEKFFTEDHYNGFPAVLVRLPRVTRAQLHTLIVGAWRCQAPPELVKEEAATARKAIKPARPARGG